MKKNWIHAFAGMTILVMMTLMVSCVTPEQQAEREAERIREEALTLQANNIIVTDQENVKHCRYLKFIDKTIYELRGFPGYIERNQLYLKEEAVILEATHIVWKDIQQDYMSAHAYQCPTSPSSSGIPALPAAP